MFTSKKFRIALVCADGSDVDVHLDENFRVLSTQDEDKDENR